MTIRVIHAESAAERAETPPTTGELVVRAQRGDAHAFGTLFARYYPRVLRIVRCRMGIFLKRFEDPEDIVQNTFQEAVRAFDHFDVRDDAALIHLFAGMVEHQIQQAAKYHRAQKRDRKRERRLRRSSGSTQIPGQLADPAQSETSVEDRLALADQRRILDECIGELAESYREVIILRDLEGGSWEWIAQELGKPSTGAARELHRRAMMALRWIAIPRLDPQ